jgi:hypothetical protein
MRTGMRWTGILLDPPSNLIRQPIRHIQVLPTAFTACGSRAAELNNAMSVSHLWSAKRFMASHGQNTERRNIP